MEQKDLKVIADRIKVLIVDDAKTEKKIGMDYLISSLDSRPLNGVQFFVGPYMFEVINSYLNENGNYSVRFILKAELNIPLNGEHKTGVTIESVIGAIGTWRENIKNSLCSGLPCPEEKEELREALNLLSSAESKLVMIDQEDLERSSIIFNYIETELK